MIRFIYTSLFALSLVVCQPTNQTTEQQNSSVTTEQQSKPAKKTQGLELPAISDQDIILERTAYTTSYDAENKIPKWVAWCLTAEHTEGNQRRLNTFLPDDDVDFPRAELVDYKRSGYDRGHLCPAGDNKWDFTPMLESFLLTNICPQNHNLNCGDWNELEIACRNWAVKYGKVYIVAGPILYKGKHETIGPNRVTVPEAFFKVVLCMTDEPKAIGFIYKNQACNNPKSSYVNTIDQVERITGIDFFPALPDDIENTIEAKANLSDW